jgi:hypothetical protein
VPVGFSTAVSVVAAKKAQMYHSFGPFITGDEKMQVMNVTPLFFNTATLSVSKLSAREVTCVQLSLRNSDSKPERFVENWPDAYQNAA